MADSITIQNPSFENLTGNDPAHFDSSGILLPGHGTTGLNLPHGSNSYVTADPIPGWQLTGGGGGSINFNGTPYFTTAATDGRYAAWANGYQNLHASISQTLSATYQVGLTYELKVDVGSPVNLPVSGYTVSLYAGGTVVASAVNSASIVPGTYSTVTLDASISSGSIAAGQPISIVLANSGYNATQTEVTFDNVRLTSTASVPEPSTWLLTTLGLVGLAASGRRTQRQ